MSSRTSFPVAQPVQLSEHLVSLDEMGMVVGDGKQAIYRWRNGNSTARSAARPHRQSRTGTR